MKDNKRKQSQRDIVDVTNFVDLTEDDDNDVGSKKRTQSKAARKSVEYTSAQRNFSVATYNVWFGPPNQFERMNAISSVLVDEGLPLFVGLQEVTQELFQALSPLLESAGYQTVCQDLSRSAYGCAIAVQQNSCHIISSGFTPFTDTIMGRGIVWVLARLKNSDCEVLFTTTHLESFVRNHPSPGQTYDGVKEREKQILQLRSFCKDCMNKRSSVDMAVITGDLNWDDERKRGTGNDKPLLSVLGNEWTDAWLESCPGKEGYTYDSKESAMLKGNLRRRFDRCLLFHRNPENLVIKEANMIGKDAIPGLKWEKPPHPMAKKQTPTVVPVLPSDHFGLLVKLQNKS